jgi:chloramphenicol-sensitive protein RarD
MSTRAEPKDSLTGVGAAALAYAIWGVVVVYWKWLGGVSAWEVLSHRVFWCLVFLIPIILVLGRWRAIRAALTTRRSLLALLVSSVLIGGNWGVFIWAVQEGRIVETSLGYYINPLLAIALGVVLLGERLSAFRIAAFVLAGIGVAVQAVALGGLPWISLVLATSFATYGYVRKVVNVEALDGLFVETLVISPMVIGYLLYLNGSGTARIRPWRLDRDSASGRCRASHRDSRCGSSRSAPVACASRPWASCNTSRRPFSLVIAVAVYSEPFDEIRLISFAFIWAALFVVSLEACAAGAPITVPETC